MATRRFLGCRSIPIHPVWSPDGRFLVYSGADVGMTFPLRAAAPDQWCADPVGVPLDQCCGLLDALAHHGAASVDRDALSASWSRPRIWLISMRVGFLCALDKHNARALLNALENNFGAIRRNVEIADHEACWQIGELPLGSGLRIQLPEILAVDRAPKKHQRSGIACERNPSRAVCQDQTWHVVRSAVGSRSAQRKYSGNLGTGIDEVLSVG